MLSLAIPFLKNSLDQVQEETKESVQVHECGASM